MIFLSTFVLVQNCFALYVEFVISVIRQDQRYISYIEYLKELVHQLVLNDIEKIGNISAKTISSHSSHFAQMFDVPVFNVFKGNYMSTPSSSSYMDLLIRKLNHSSTYHSSTCHSPTYLSSTDHSSTDHSPTDLSSTNKFFTAKSSTNISYSTLLSSAKSSTTKLSTGKPSTAKSSTTKLSTGKPSTAKFEITKFAISNHSTKNLSNK